eukprot:2045458-Rhodomonas_salina.6
MQDTLQDDSQQAAAKVQEGSAISSLLLRLAKQCSRLQSGPECQPEWQGFENETTHGLDAAARLIRRICADSLQKGRGRWMGGAVEHSPPTEKARHRQHTPASNRLADMRFACVICVVDGPFSPQATFEMLQVRKVLVNVFLE